MAGNGVESNAISDIHLPRENGKLRELAAQVSGDIPVYEGGFFIPAVFLMLGVFFPYTAWQTLAGGQVLSALIVLLIGIFALFMFWRIMQGRKTPFFVLTPQGLDCSVFKKPLPWQAVKDFKVKASDSNILNFAVSMEFDVAGKLAPEQNKKCRLGTRYDAENGKLFVSGLNFRSDINRKILLEQLAAYRLAALARDKLQIKGQE